MSKFRRRAYAQMSGLFYKRWNDGHWYLSDKRLLVEYSTQRMSDDEFVETVKTMVDRRNLKQNITAAAVYNFRNGVFMRLVKMENETVTLKCEEFGNEFEISTKKFNREYSFSMGERNEDFKFHME